MAKKCPKCQSDNPGTATFCADCGTQLPSIKDFEVTEIIEAPKYELPRETNFFRWMIGRPVYLAP